MGITDKKRKDYIGKRLSHDGKERIRSRGEEIE
jgi:hypothetical protein